MKRRSSIPIKILEKMMIVYFNCGIVQLQNIHLHNIIQQRLKFECSRDVYSWLLILMVIILEFSSSYQSNSNFKINKKTLDRHLIQTWYHTNESIFNLISH